MIKVTLMGDFRLRVSGFHRHGDHLSGSPSAASGGRFSSPHSQDVWSRSVAYSVHQLGVSTNVRTTFTFDYRGGFRGARRSPRTVRHGRKDPRGRDLSSTEVGLGGPHRVPQEAT